MRGRMPHGSDRARSVAARSRQVRVLCGMRGGVYHGKNHLYPGAPDGRRDPATVSSSSKGEIRLIQSRRRRACKASSADRCAFVRSRPAAAMRASSSSTQVANVNFDLQRFGIEWVASPRHADALVLSGPLTKNMADAVRLAWDAIARTPIRRGVRGLRDLRRPLFGRPGDRSIVHRRCRPRASTSLDARPIRSRSCKQFSTSLG